MNINEMKQIVRVAKMYYELGMSQETISEKEKISKSTVSRLMKKAVSEGFIKISINYPIQSVQELEEKFKKVFKLKKTFLAPVIVDDLDLVMQDVCKAVGQDLSRIIRDDDIIGVSWGHTMECVAGNLPEINRQSIKIVQLNGGVSRNVRPTRSASIIENFAAKLNGISYILYSQAIVDNKKIVDILSEDSHIKEVFDMIKHCRIAIFGIGYMSFESVLYEAKYFTKKGYEDLQKSGAVGDVCARYFDVNGRVADKALDSRSMGVSLEELKEKEYSIGVAIGEHRAKATLGALRSGCINVLYTDENTARAILDANDKF